MEFKVIQNNNVLNISADTNNVRWLCSVDGNFSLDGYGGVTDSSITIIPNDYTGFASGYIYFTYFDDGCMRNYTHQVTYHDNSWENVFPEVDRFEAGFDNQYKEFTVNTNQKGWTVNVPQGYIAIKVSDSKFYLIKKSGGAEANIEASIRNNQVTIGASVDPTAVIIMEPAAISGLMYNGKEQALVSNGKADSKTGVIVYRLDNGPWITTPPKATDAGSGYKVCYMASGNTGYKNSEITCISDITIEKAPTTVVPPTAIDGLVYNGKEQALINPASSSAGTITYSLSESGTWSTSVPSVVNANENGYTVYYKVTPDSNHIGDVSGSVRVSVAKGTPTITPPIPIEPTYNGQLQQLITPAFADFGVLYYQGGDQSSFKTTIPRATNVTTEPGYTINYKVSGDSNINEVVGSIYANIMKVTPTLVPPTPYSLSYTGEDRELIAAGSTNFGTLEYSGGNLSNWSTEIPKKSAVGRYTIFYRVSGDTNINEVSGSVMSEISTGKPEYTPPVSKTDLVFNGEEQELLISGSASGGTMYYSFNEDGPWDSTDVPTASGASAYTTYWFISGDTGLGNVGPIMIPVIIDKAPNVFIEEPTASAMTYMEESTPPYSGIAQQLVTSGVTSAGTSGGTILYKTVEDGGWIDIVPSGMNAGDYTVYYMISGNSNFYDSESANTKAVIEKKTPQVVPPKANSPIIYDGEEHPLLIAGSVQNGWGEIVYSMDNTEWSAEVPSASAIGTYNVFWKLPGDDNHNGITTSTIPVEITQGVAEIITMPTKISGLIYTGNAQDLINAGVAKNGTMVYKIENGDWSTSIPQGIEEDTYDIYFMASGDTGYANSQTYQIQGSIGIAEPIYTAPQNVDVEYQAGVEQNLLIPGEVTTGGTMMYTLDGSSWSESVPKATDPGTYTMQWKIVADTGYADVGPNIITSYIRSSAPTITDPTPVQGLKYTGSPLVLVNAGTTTVGTFYYKIGEDGQWSTDLPQATEINTYHIYWKVEDGSTTYASGDFTVTISGEGFTPPSPKTGLVCDNTEKELVNEGSVDGGTMYYTLTPDDESSWSTNVTKAITANTYVTYWKGVAGGETLTSDTVSTTIEKYTPNFVTEPSSKTIQFDGNDHELVNAGTCDSGTVLYNCNDGGWSSSIPTGRNEGNYVVKYMISGDCCCVADKSSDSYSVTSVISSAEYTPPTPKTGLVYDGNNQQLVNQGGGDGVSFVYQVGSGQLHEDIPEGKDANTYHIKWYANKGWSEIGSGEFDVTIAQATTEIWFDPSSIGYVEVGSVTHVDYWVDPYDSIITFSSTSDSVATYDKDAMALNAVGAGNCKIVATVNETTNYTAARAELDVTVKNKYHDCYHTFYCGNHGDESIILLYANSYTNPLPSVLHAKKSECPGISSEYGSVKEERYLSFTLKSDGFSSAHKCYRIYNNNANISQAADMVSDYYDSENNKFVIVYCRNYSDNGDEYIINVADHEVYIPTEEEHESSECQNSN